MCHNNRHLIIHVILFLDILLEFSQRHYASAKLLYPVGLNKKSHCWRHSACNCKFVLQDVTFSCQNGLQNCTKHHNSRLKMENSAIKKVISNKKSKNRITYIIRHLLLWHILMDFPWFFYYEKLQRKSNIFLGWMITSED